MRLRSVWLSEYKNLRDFTITFEGEGFIDIFVGKNGSGKSNFQEAVIEIFDHLFDFDPEEAGPTFDYAISFEVAGEDIAIGWRNAELMINGDAGRRGLGQTPVPDHLLVYYSGHNPNVGELINKYELRFESKIDGPGFANSPKIIAITEGLKDLFLTMMLLLPDAHVGRQALISRLGIKTVGPEMRLMLHRPIYARGRNSSQFDVDHLQGNKYWNPRGATGDFLSRLETCFSTTPERGPIRTEGYQAEIDAYFLFLDLDKLRTEFAGDGMCSLFRQFYSLKVLEMLVSTSIEVELESGFRGGTSGFSDGQFQMVYMLAAAELFKDRNVISLFDEPDAFLHPEWQFEFLNQIDAISAQAARTNHILLNSHSASTIAAKSPGRIRQFEPGEHGMVASQKDKSEIIKSLSAGLITFSESEARLSVEFILSNTSGPVLFTEGVSDVAILETAWKKLHGDAACPFEIVQAFDCAFLRNLLRRSSLYENHPNRNFFGLFDFDGAHADWAQLGQEIETDVSRCLTRKPVNHPAYAMLLPVAQAHPLRGQVVRPDGQNYGALARFSIELLFYGATGLDQYFGTDITEPSQPVKFVGNKVAFAQEVVPSLDPQHFEPFRPIFDFIQSKIAET